MSEIASNVLEEQPTQPFHSAVVVADTYPELGMNSQVKTGEDFIAYAARVSNPKNQMNTKTAPKLLKFLMREHHWSPFEMVNICMRIKTTRDIGRQIIRHRSFAFQEFSQRYADPTETGEVGFRDARLQDQKNRQNSIELEPDSELNEDFMFDQVWLWQKSLELYDAALEKGIAKEQARTFLPEGLTPTVMFMNGSLRSWIHYCQLRRGNGTQKEHMIVADSCWEQLRQYYPTVVEACEEMEQKEEIESL